MTHSSSLPRATLYRFVVHREHGPSATMPRLMWRRRDRCPLTLGQPRAQHRIVLECVCLGVGSASRSVSTHFNRYSTPELVRHLTGGRTAATISREAPFPVPASGVMPRTVFSARLDPIRRVAWSEPVILSMLTEAARQGYLTREPTSLSPCLSDDDNSHQWDEENTDDGSDDSSSEGGDDDDDDD